MDYIMETFPIVKRKDEQKHGEYRTKRVILEIYDAMTEAIRTGKPYQTRLDPPPADPRVAHGHIEKELDTELIRLYSLLLVSELAADPIKTFIVKTLYIAKDCRQVRQKYPWKIRNFGPYPEGDVFDMEIASLREKGFVEKLEEQSQVPDQPIQINDQGIAKIRNLEEQYPLHEIKDAIKSIVTDFQRYGRHDMELRATLVWVYKSNPDLDYESLVREFRKIKGDKFHEHEIEKAYIELSEKGYIEAH
ncbi:MAG: hypothetical protein ACREOI_27945 [bacterium]